MDKAIQEVFAPYPESLYLITDSMNYGFSFSDSKYGQESRSRYSVRLDTLVNTNFAQREPGTVDVLDVGCGSV